MTSQPKRAVISLLVAALLCTGLWMTEKLSAAAESPSLSGMGDNAASAEPSGPVVVRIHVRDREHLSAVAGELDIWEAHRELRFAVAAVTPAQYRWLQHLGYRLEVDPGKTALLGLMASLDPRFYYFDNHYANANGLYVLDFLQYISTAFPDLTELLDIGDAWLAGQPGEHDRDIWVLQITNEDPSFGAIRDKPAFFLFANIHAREVATPELAIRYIRHLTEGYGGEGGYGADADVTWLVNHNVAYILVMQNPDGHVKNEQNTSSSVGWGWRKNLDSDDGCPDANTWGVDLNRNHSFLWGCCGGSSGNPCAETYRGPGDASEPETQAFQDYFATVMLDQNGPNADSEIPQSAPPTTTGIFVSLHSYGDLVLWPWGFQGYGASPNYNQMRTIGRKFAYFNGYEPAGTIWYDVDGATDDWTYGKFGIPSFTFEVGPSEGLCGGFFPAYGCIDGVDGMPRNFWAEMVPVFLYAHKIARLPYLTAYGPDTHDLEVKPDVVSPGTTVSLMATVADHRLGDDPLQPIAAAEYFIDAPGEDGSGVPLVPADGSWGGLKEEVTAEVDSSGLALGQHYVLFHGQNEAGEWGPFSAAFLHLMEPGSAPVIEGYVREADTEDPLGATVTADVFEASTDPATGYYSMTLISGTYDLLAEADGHASVSVTGIKVLERQTLQQDFFLPVVCALCADDMESGEGWWSHLASLGTDHWSLSTAQSHSPTHTWHVPDDDTETDSFLWNASPIQVDSSSLLTFWHRHQFESNYDGAVLEISTDGGGSWTDLGPYITAYGYNGTISDWGSNPLGGRSAWVGDQTTWTQVQVDLSSFADEDVHIRWRIGCDASVPDTGWYIDDVAIMTSGPGCNPLPQVFHYLPIITKDG